MQYVSRNPLIPTLQNLARFNETIIAANTNKNTNILTNKDDVTVKLLRDKDTLNAFLTDIQHIIHETSYNTKTTILKDVKDILENLKELSTDNLNKNAKKDLTQALSNISKHVKLSNNLVHILNDINESKLDKEYIKELFKTLDKSTLYKKQDKLLTNTISSLLTSKSSLVNKTINKQKIKYNILQKKRHKTNLLLLNTATTICNKLKSIGITFKKLVTVTWKKIAISIDYMTKKLKTLSTSILNMVFNVFGILLKFISAITKTLFAITNALTSFLAKNILGIISGALSGVWSFLTSHHGIKVLTFISGYIYGRYIKGYINNFIEKLKVNNFDLNSILDKKINNLKDKIIEKITTNNVFKYAGALAKNVVDGIAYAGTVVKGGVDNVMPFIQSVNTTGEFILGKVNELSPVLGNIYDIGKNVLPIANIVSSTMAGLAFGPIGGLVGAAIGIGSEIISSIASSHIADLQMANYIKYKALVDASYEHQQAMKQIQSDNADTFSFYSRIAGIHNNFSQKLSLDKIKRDASIETPYISNNTASFNSLDFSNLSKQHLERLNSKQPTPQMVSGLSSLTKPIAKDSFPKIIETLKTNAVAKSRFTSGYIGQSIVDINESANRMQLLDVNLSTNDTQQIFADAYTKTFPNNSPNFKTIGTLSSDETQALKTTLLSKYKDVLKNKNPDITFTEDMISAMNDNINAILEYKKMTDSSSNYADTKYDDALSILEHMTKNDSSVSNMTSAFNLKLPNSIQTSENATDKVVNNVMPNLATTLNGNMRPIANAFANVVDFISTQDSTYSTPTAIAANPNGSENLLENVLAQQAEVFFA